MSNVTHYLIFDRIRVENANAISSPITYGFPALTGFVGAIHALTRKIPESFDLTFGGVLVANHQYDLQAFRKNKYSEYTFNQQRMPIERTGKTAPIIEEGRIHLIVSLVVEVKAEKNRLNAEQQRDELTQWAKTQLMSQHLAGGSVFSIQSVTLEERSKEDEIIKLLLPAFVLMDATTDLIEITKELQKEDAAATPLDALIATAKLTYNPDKSEIDDISENHVSHLKEKKSTEKDKTEKEITWNVSSVKKGRGWIVPIPIGYQGIHPTFEKGELLHGRSDHYESQYVEQIYTLGKWVFPKRIHSLKNAFWHYAEENEQGYYLVQDK